MATRIIEFGGDDRADELPILPYKQYVTAQTALTATGVSAQSAAFNAGTTLIVLDTDEQIYFHVDSNPTATTAHIRLAAGDRVDISVKPGDKVAIRT